MRASGPPASRTNVFSTVRRPSLSSAPPIAISGPGLAPASRAGPSGASWVGPFGMRRSLRGARVALVTDRRRLIVMRHAKAEPFASTDHSRRLTDRGRASARDAGAYLREHGLTPDHALVSSATRTRETWTSMTEELDESGTLVFHDDAWFTGSVDVVVEALRALPDDALTVVFVGHNPTAAYLCH